MYEFLFKRINYLLTKNFSPHDEGMIVGSILYGDGWKFAFLLHGESDLQFLPVVGRGASPKIVEAMVCDCIDDLKTRFTNKRFTVVFFDGGSVFSPERITSFYSSSGTLEKENGK